MAWLSNGIALRNAAQVFGASCSSKRAWNVKSPAWTISWLIYLSNLAVGGGAATEFNQSSQQEAKNVPICRRIWRPRSWRPATQLPAILGEPRYWSGFLLSNDIPKIPVRCTSSSGTGAFAACGGGAFAACG